MEERLNKIFQSIFYSNDNFDIKLIVRDVYSNWDSINHLNLISSIEEEFEIRLDIDEINKIVDYESALNIIIKKK